MQLFQSFTVQESGKWSHKWRGKKYQEKIFKVAEITVCFWAARERPVHELKKKEQQKIAGRKERQNY